MPVFRSLLAAALLAFSAGAFARACPAEPVRIIAGFAPGSATDIPARLGADPLSRSAGHSFVVENKPAAGGSVGTAQAKEAAPDSGAPLD